MANAITISGEREINLARMITLKAALKIEMRGLKRRGRSAYSIIKQEYNLRGNKEKVLKQLEALIERKGNELRASA